MLDTNDIDKMVEYMSDDLESNINRIKKEFGSLKYSDDSNQSILHILTSNKYDEYKLSMAICSLLNYTKKETNIDVNLQNTLGQNFIQTALYTGYSEMFITTIIAEGVTKKENKLNINHVDLDGNTIMHTLIDSGNYPQLTTLYEIFCNFGFDSTIKNKKGMDIYKYALDKKIFSNEELRKFKKMFLNEISKNDELLREYHSKLKEFGTVLNELNYKSSPAIMRDKEIKQLEVALAHDTKNPILIGESGIGKTAIVKQLAYEMKKGNVPKFLQNKVILEVNASELVSGNGIVGAFEEHIKELISLVREYNVILFIDNIHSIYGVGASKNNDNDLAVFLKYYMDKYQDLKIIGTTNKENYTKYISNSSLKDLLYPININEPDEFSMYEIISKVINDYCKKNSVVFENEEYKSKIVEIILELTNKKSRKYNDSINNPSLAISIVDDAFAYVKYYDDKCIKIDYFIEAVESCERIYKGAREIAIDKLNELKYINDDKKTKTKIIKFNL